MVVIACVLWLTHANGAIHCTPRNAVIHIRFFTFLPIFATRNLKRLIERWWLRDGRQERRWEDYFAVGLDLPTALTEVSVGQAVLALTGLAVESELNAFTAVFLG